MIIYYGDEILTPPKRIGVIGLVI